VIFGCQLAHTWLALKSADMILLNINFCGYRTLQQGNFASYMIEVVVWPLGTMNSYFKKHPVPRATL
jgi:hypothetical protein